MYLKSGKELFELNWKILIMTQWWQLLISKNNILPKYVFVCLIKTIALHLHIKEWILNTTLGNVEKILATQQMTKYSLWIKNVLQWGLNPRNIHLSCTTVSEHLIKRFLSHVGKRNLYSLYIIYSCITMQCSTIVHYLHEQYMVAYIILCGIVTTPFNTVLTKTEHFKSEVCGLLYGITLYCTVVFSIPTSSEKMP